MARKPSRTNSIVLAGVFSFRASTFDGNELADKYQLNIEIPLHHGALPIVHEVGGKIPNTSEFHINRDRSLCLGSPLRLLMAVSKPSGIKIFTRCLVQYLYAVSRKLQSGGGFIFGELDHGNPGLFNDYKDLFNLKNDYQVKEAINLLGMKRRVANKKPCPCGCGRRLGKCSLRLSINKVRELAPRSWHRKNALE